MTINVALAGAGAFGIRHLDGIRNIDGVKVVSLVSREPTQTREVASRYGIGHVTTYLEDSLALKEVNAVNLCTPTQMHAAQTLACLKVGKHVQVEIPLADTLTGADLQDREFFAAIQAGREPNSSVAQVLTCYQVLRRLEQQLNEVG